MAMDREREQQEVGKKKQNLAFVTLMKYSAQYSERY